jgi:hypothetical protein
MAMKRGEMDYHQFRAEQCRKMALTAELPEVRRRHEQLAELHSAKAQHTESLVSS